MKKRVKYYVVEGSGPFPFDMLRYDASYPSDSSDARAMAGDKKGTRRVLLVRTDERDPTDGRWASFMWRVVATFHDNEQHDARQVRDFCGFCAGDRTVLHSHNCAVARDGNL